MQRKTRIFLVIGTLLLGAGVAAAFLLPQWVERTGRRALARVESRLGLHFSAERYAWDWSGAFDAHGITIRAGDAVLATLDHAHITSEVAFWRREVALSELKLKGLTFKLTRDADGTTNVDPVLSALLSASAQGGSAQRSIRVLPEIPRVEIDDLTFAIDLAFQSPLGDHRQEALFQGGTLSLHAETHAEHLRQSPFTLEGHFASSSFDPDQPLHFAWHGTLDTLPSHLRWEPTRPLRFWFGERVIGLGTIRLDDGILTMQELRLSEQVQDPSAEIPAAFSCQELRWTLPPNLVRTTPDALASFPLHTAFQSPAHLHLKAPVLALAHDNTNRSNLDDLLALLGLHTPALPAEDTPPAEAALPSAPKAPQNLPERLTDLLTMLEKQSTAQLATLAKHAPILAPYAFSIEQGELFYKGPLYQLQLKELSLSNDLTQRPPLRIESAFLSDEDPTHPGRIQLALDPQPNALKATLQADNIPLNLLSIAIRSKRISSLPEGRIQSLQAELTHPAPTQLLLEYDLSLSDLVIDHDALNTTPFAVLALQLGGDLSWDARTRTLDLKDGIIKAHDLFIGWGAQLSHSAAAPTLDLHATLPPTPIQAVIEAFPAAFRPLLSGLQIAGEMDWDLKVALDSARPMEIAIHSQPQARNFKVLSLGNSVNFNQLRRRVAYSIRLKDGSPGQRFVGPDTGAWVPLEDITPYLPLALTTTEDGTFERNAGYSPQAMVDSIGRNLEKGAFVRGASTLTQQLVKNIYLSGDKTISRKLQELFVAWQMSKALSKDEVMALYLNTIEFGPGIYGIGDAAAHYFGKRPIDLNLTEAIFFASIIPSPRRYYSFFEQGRVTPRWSTYLERLLQIMVKRQKISQDEYEAAAPYRPRFRGSDFHVFDDETPADFDTLPDREPSFAPTFDPPFDD